MEDGAKTGESYQHFFTVRLDLFDGPIDLLLHLVKSQELPLEKLSLAAVADQYLACIRSSQQFDLEVAGEYLLIAATLVSIKSSLLLNEQPALIEDEEGNLVDPHQELLARLKQAAIYKEGAFKLSCQKVLGIDVFAPPSVLGAIAAPTPTYKIHDPFLLGSALQKMLRRLPPEEQFFITLDAVSVVESMNYVLDRLKSNGGRAMFSELLRAPDSRGVFVGAFLALLELCKRQLVCVRQEQSFDDFEVIFVDNLSAMDAINSSEFDEGPGSQIAEG